MPDFKPSEHITKLQGKDYLEVKWRLVWLRQDNPDATVDTEILTTDGIIIVKARVSIGGQLIATGHGTAPLQGKGSWSGREVEKAETAAIGRALAHAGYGTQFTGEDEDDNIADSPVESKPSKGKSKPAAKPDNKVINMEPPANASDKRKAIWEQVKGGYVTYDEYEADLARISDQLTADSTTEHVVNLLAKLGDAS